MDDYYDIRSEIKTGDVVRAEGSALFSRGIQTLSKSQFSHVGFILVLEKIDRILVFESVESKGVRAIPLSNYLDNYDGKGNGYHGKVSIVRHSGFELVPDSHLIKMMEFYIDKLGMNYDYKQIIHIAKRLLFKTGKRRDDDKEYICSEYVGEGFLLVMSKFKTKYADFILPCDFDEQNKFYKKWDIK